MAWTDERVEKLKTLWAEGLSARQIAEQLGGVTRNAVIGKVHRLGLSGRATSNNSSTGGRAKTAARKPTKKRAAAEQPAKVAAAVGAEAAAKPQKSASATMKTADDATAKPQPEPEVVNLKIMAPVDELVVPLDERVGIESLREGQCKWPIGDPTHEDFHFCGRNQHGEGVYCEFHTAKAYQPARRAVRKKEPQRQLLAKR